MAREYDVIIEQDKKTKQLYASVPLLPGCYTYADSMDDLLKNIKEAIDLHLETMKAKKITEEKKEIIGMVKVAL